MTDRIAFLADDLELQIHSHVADDRRAEWLREYIEAFGEVLAREFGAEYAAMVLYSAADDMCIHVSDNAYKPGDLL